MTQTRARASRRAAPDHEAAIAGAEYRRHRRVRRSERHARPRLLQLLATGGTGGAQESYTGLLLGLDRSRYEVRALSLSAGNAVSRLRRLGIAVDVIEEADDERAVRRLAAHLRGQEIDLVHAHMFRAEVIGTRAAVAARTPVITATVHSSRVRSRQDVELIARLTPHMDHLIVPSSSIAAKVRAEGRGGARFSIIPNGVDLSRFSTPAPPCTLRHAYGIPRDAPLIGVVARLEPEKGHRHLIAAMPQILDRVPDAWLAIVGEGSLGTALRAQATDLAAPARDRIIFTGRREDVASVTADLAVAVLPSLREAQGISLLEAMARRVPVVASAVGGIPEVITHQVDGLLVPPADAEQLALAVAAVLADPALAARLGDAGYRTVAERYSSEAMVRRIQAVYDEELSRAGVRPAWEAPEPTRRADRPPAGRAALEVPPS